MYTLLIICIRCMCLCILYAHTCVAFSYLDKYLPIVYIAKWFMSWAWITAQLNSSLCVKKKNILWCESLAFQPPSPPLFGWRVKFFMINGTMLQSLPTCLHTGVHKYLLKYELTLQIFIQIYTQYQDTSMY